MKIDQLPPAISGRHFWYSFRKKNLFALSIFVYKWLLTFYLENRLSTFTKKIDFRLLL